MKVILLLCIFIATDAYCKRASTPATSEDIFKAPSGHAKDQGSKGQNGLPTFGEESWAPEGDESSTGRPQSVSAPGKKKDVEEDSTIADAVKKLDEEDKNELVKTDVAIIAMTNIANSQLEGQVKGITNAGALVDQNNDKTPLDFASGAAGSDGKTYNNLDQLKAQLKLNPNFSAKMRTKDGDEVVLEPATAEAVTV